MKIVIILIPVTTTKKEENHLFLIKSKMCVPEAKIEDLEDIVKYYNESSMNKLSESKIFIILSKFLTYLDEHKEENHELYNSNFNLYFSKLRPSFNKLYFFSLK